ncbi:MAG: glycosyltransferase, partial [Acidiferrobacterales bacterium]
GSDTAPEAKSVDRFSDKRKRIAVYTTIVDGYDEPKFPEVISPHCDYICFTDQTIGNPGVWQLHGIDYFNVDPTRIARYIKTHPHTYLPEYDWSIWVDANLLIHSDLAELVFGIPDNTLFATFQHPHRECLYKEAEEVIRRQLDDAGLVRQQVERYHQDGYPEGVGLAETNVVVRRHNHPTVVAVNTDWWREIENGSRRDQLSLNYVVWKRNLHLGNIAPRGISVRNDERFTRFQHKNGSTYRHSAKALAAARNVSRKTGIHFIRKRFVDRKTAFDHLTVDIIVCVHDSLDDVRLCFEALNRNRTSHQRFILVDDGSSSETKSYLEGLFTKGSKDVLIRHDHALGYTKAANVGLRASTGDYAVLLNSDTIVSEDWLTKILECSESSPDIGIVGPMSNAASWQSMPELLDTAGDLAVNALPKGLTVDEMSRFCESWSSGVFPRVPLINGFCVAIKRSLIERIGYFDEDAFPQGYGEENDYCFRAVDAGFIGAIAAHCFVFHSKSKSYTHERRRSLSKKGSAAFRAKYPKSRIDNAILTMKVQPDLARIRMSLRDWMARGQPPDELGDRPTEKKPPGTQPISSTQGKLKAAELRPQQGAHSSGMARDQKFLSYDVSSDVLGKNWTVIERFRANPRLELGRALWIVPFFDHIYRGGIYTIFRVADSFSRKFGALNIIAIHGERTIELRQVESMIKRAFPRLIFQLVTVSESQDVDKLPPSDAAFCTLWTSAYLLLRYNKCKGKFYFVQDFEPAFYAAGATYGLIEQTYRFGFNGIANTPGVGEWYRQYNPWVECFIPGVDKSVFYPDPNRLNRKGPQRVVFYGRPKRDRNAFQLGVEALRIVKQTMGDAVEIVSAGAEFSVSEYDLEGVMENRGILASLEEVAALYRSSDVGLVFMYTAHPSYQPFEFMASGCATVSNLNRHTQWLLRDRENSILADSTVTCVAERILEVLRNHDLRSQIVEAGLSTVAGLEWDTALTRISNFVCRPSPGPREFISATPEVVQSASLGQTRTKVPIFSVLFVLPSRPGGGGVHSVMQEAKGMRDFGVNAQVAIPRVYSKHYRKSYPSDFSKSLLIYKDTKDLARKCRGFAVVIATHNASVRLVREVQRANINILPAYYVQDYEPFFYCQNNADKLNHAHRLTSSASRSRERELLREARESYTALPEGVLFAKTRWLCEIVERRHGVHVHKVSPSVDHEVFFPPQSAPPHRVIKIAAMVRFFPPQSTPPQRVIKIAAMVRWTSPRRAPALTMHVLSRVAKQYEGGVEIDIFGSPDKAFVEEGVEVSFPIRNRGLMTREGVADILRQADIFVDFSEYQAFGRTALEAMACRTAVIVPKRGGTGEYARHGENVLVIDTKRDDECFKALQTLLLDDDLRRKLADAAVETAASYSIAEAALSELTVLRTIWRERYISE